MNVVYNHRIFALLCLSIPLQSSQYLLYMEDLLLIRSLRNIENEKLED